MKHLLPTIFITLLILGCGTENVPTFKLTVSVSPTEGGSITPSNGVFDKNEDVVVTATPSNGWKFSRWEGDWSGTTNPITVKMSKDYNIIGVFERKDYPLTITILGEGTVTETIIPQKTTDYPFQTVVELTPTPSEGWSFVQWGGDLSGNEVPKRITVDGNKTVTVTFQKKNYSLNVSVVGNGTVRVEPQQEVYPHGSQVTLTPIPSEGWTFVQWGGDVSGTTVPLSVTVSKEMNVTVTFTRIAYLNQNGITIMCPNGKVGEIGIVDGVQYEVVDRGRLNQRRDEGKDLTKVCTSLVTNMSRLFLDFIFNQSIGNWDVSNVTNMEFMFRRSNFNRDISKWDVSNVINMHQLFIFSEFNQPIGDWDVSNVINMSLMFQSSSFNQPIGNWNVSNVSNMEQMFQEAIFNQDISQWNVSSVKVMKGMFNTNQQFNQPIGNWDVRNVVNMSLMFEYSLFNQPIGNWDVSNVSNMSAMFSGSRFNQPIENWNVSSVTNMSSMFGNSQFNQPIGNWNVGSVTNMIQMFRDSKFNQPIGNWNVSSVTNMGSMFKSSPFNQPINRWCVTQIPTEPSDFSTSSPLTPENKPIWGTCPTN